MSEATETMTERRVRLAGEIARQRTELAKAYRDLEKPIHYAEYGLRGFGFLRQNPWVFAVVPAAFSIGANVWKVRQGTKEPKLSARQKKILEVIEKKPKNFAGRVMQLGRYGWKLLKLYRRVRPYFLP